MTTASPPRTVAVLDSAITWTHSCLQLARGVAATTPTPCGEWDLGALLAHVEDSLAALAEAADLGLVGTAVTDPADPAETADPARQVDRIVQRACHVRAAWAHRVTSAPVGVDDLALGRDTLLLVGALEIAVHGWDVAHACGADRPLPEDLALRLLDVAVLVVTPEERGRRFAAPVAVPAGAPAGTRLLAHLGRHA